MNRIKEFLRELVNNTKKDTISIVLFGSTTTEKFEIGKSDVDLIFVVENKQKKKVLEKKLFYLIMKLDRKYKLELSKVCFGFNDGLFRRLIISIENLAYFRMPFAVFTKNELDLERSKINNLKMFLASKLLVSVKSFAINIKKYGVVLYGENLVSELKTSSLTNLDRYKIFLTIFWVFIFGLISLPFDWKFAMEHFDKARKYRLNLIA